MIKFDEYDVDWARKEISDLKGTGKAFSKMAEIYDAVERLDKEVYFLQHRRTELLQLADVTNTKYQELSAADYNYYLHITRSYWHDDKGYKVVVAKVPSGIFVNEDNISAYSGWDSPVDVKFSTEIKARDWRRVKLIVAELLEQYPIHQISKTRSVSDAIYKIPPKINKPLEVTA